MCVCVASVGTYVEDTCACCLHGHFIGERWVWLVLIFLMLLGPGVKPVQERNMEYLEEVAIRTARFVSSSLPSPKSIAPFASSVD